MKKPKKMPPKPPRKPNQRPPRPAKAGGDPDEEELARLEKPVGYNATGDTAAKAMILSHFISYSKLFECRWGKLFDRDPMIQRKLKNDFKGSLLDFVEWINAPGNQVPVHSSTKAKKTGDLRLKKFIGFKATGQFAAKAIILGYYHPYGQLIEDVIREKFEADSDIQSRLLKCGNSLYRLLHSF